MTARAAIAILACAVASAGCGCPKDVHPVAAGSYGVGSDGGSAELRTLEVSTDRKTVTETLVRNGHTYVLTYAATGCLTTSPAGTSARYDCAKGP